MDSNDAVFELVWPIVSMYWILVLNLVSYRQTYQLSLFWSEAHFRPICMSLRSMPTVCISSMCSTQFNSFILHLWSSLLLVVRGCIYICTYKNHFLTVPVVLG